VTFGDLLRQALGRGRDTSAMTTSQTGTDTSGPDVWLVVGLGNPGPSYSGHRHNVGYLVTDELARRLGAGFRAHKSGRADVVEGRLGAPGAGGARVVLARPRCYMNESGGPVKALATFYKIAPSRIVAVHDELDIGFGTLRVKLGGGDNGHNGLRSMRSSLGTGDFFRVRAGIGRPPGRQDVADFVLSNYSPTERKELPFHVDRAADAVESLVLDGLERTQQTFNS
jgi:peptidyl-tRNA hydrolase, PTH1 family